eukprot:jgi/Chlat1/8510/Chrsp80S07814
MAAAAAAAAAVGTVGAARGTLAVTQRRVAGRSWPHRAAPRHRRTQAVNVAKEPDADNAESREAMGAGEYFQSLLRRTAPVRRSIEDAVGPLPDFAERRQRESDAQTASQPEDRSDGGFLKLAQAREWLNNVDAAAPTNEADDWVSSCNPAILHRRRLHLDACSSQRDFEMRSWHDEWMQEYAALKVDLFEKAKTTSAAGTAFFLLTWSAQAAIGYAFGAAAGFAYLNMLVKYVDSLQGALPDKKPSQRYSSARGLTSQKLAEGIKTTLQGSQKALTNPRLLLPIALVVAWKGWSLGTAEHRELHVPLAPILLGFFAFKAGFYAKTLDDNGDLLFGTLDPTAEETER